MTPTLTDFFPDWLAAFVRETARELQVPEDAVAVLALGTVAAAINGGANSRPNKTWIEPVVLYTLALLASGEGKSPVFARLFDPVLAASEQISGERTGDLNEQKTRNMLRKMREAQIRRDAIKAVNDGYLTMEEATAYVTVEQRNLHAPQTNAIPVRVLTDTTPAGLLDALDANDGRIVVASPEAEALLAFRGPSKEAVLKGFDGELLRQTRRTTGEITIERPAINMVIAMQPTVLEALGTKMVDRGVMPRFLMAFPDSLVGRRYSRPRLTSVRTSKAYAAAIAAIVARFSKPGAPEMILWTTPARAEIVTWRDEIEPRLAPDGDLAPIGAWGSKIRGAHLIRLAALLAIMDGESVVTKEHAERAKGLCRILMADAVRAFAEMGASFAEDDLVHLMEKVGRLNGEPFAKRVIVRSSNRFTKDKVRCDEVLALAVEKGLLIREGDRYQAVAA